MGCDIHAFAERKQDNKWIMLGDNFEHKDWEDKSYFDNEVYQGRNYELFSFLADVRNYNDVIPLSNPKGVPVDASHGYLNEVEQYGEDGHSHSYFTLKELKEAPVDLINQEIDDKSLILDRDNDGNITSTCGATNGKHLGKVGKRKLFKLFKDEKNPIDEIIKHLEEVRDDYSLKDDEVRTVFFFDN